MSRTCAERHLGPPSTRPGDPGAWKSTQICKTPRVDFFVDFVPAREGVGKHLGPSEHVLNDLGPPSIRPGDPGAWKNPRNSAKPFA